MSLTARNIHSLTDFVRNPKTHLAALKATRKPAILTVRGQAEVVLLDPETYETLIDRLARAENLLAEKTGGHRLTVEDIENLQANLREAFNL